MKTVKIILGFLILVGTGSEYANASRQLFTFFSPGILLAVLTMLLLSTWLIASGLSKETLQLKSFQFLKFFMMTFSFFGLVTCISLASIKTPNDIVEFNNIKVPIGKFMDGSRRIVPDPEERKAYCSCIVEKLANSQKILNDYRTELESGEIDKIFEALKSEDHFAELGIESCLGSIELQWTDNMANSMKEKMKSQLTDTEFERTNDLDNYCDCLIEEYRKHPLSKITEDGFNKSELSLRIDSICTEKSQK